MNSHDETSSKIREALDREVARRFDEERCAGTLVHESSEGAHHPAVVRHDRREGPFGRLPVAVQWAALAAALLGAALGIRSFYIERTRSEPPAPQARIVAEPIAPPGADASFPVLGEASAPPLHAAPPNQAPQERKLREAVPVRPVDDVVAEASPPLEPLGAPESKRSSADSPKDSGAAAGLIATSVPGAKNEGAATAAAEGPRTVGGTLPIVVNGPVGSDVTSGPGVQVLSARIAGHPVRPKVREVPEVGATLVLLPALANLSASYGNSGPSDAPFAPARLAAPPTGMTAFLPGRGARGPRGGGPERASLASYQANGQGTGGVLAPRNEEIPVDDPNGAPDQGGTAGAYYVRFFLGSRFEPIPERSQGLMGDGLHVVPLRENEVWGDEEQERFLSKTFRLSSVVAVDGARIEPDAEDHQAESNFFVGVAGHLFDVWVQGSPAETAGFHRIELRVLRADGRRGESTDGLTILTATLIVENGRVIVLGIPEPDDAVHAKRGPRVVFLALSPRFERFARPADAEPVYVIRGDIDPPMLVEKTMPEYSPEARERGAEGKVVLQAVIRKDGAVDGVQVLRVPQVPGAEFLVEAAARAVRQWRYLPAQLDGEPVNVYFTIVVQFTLERDQGT